MYEYVRRQQELQPGVFATKTFQWMDGTMREPSWARMHSRAAPMDPLTCSSSSLFGGPQTAKHGTLSALQRSAASLSQHPAVLALRRHRQSSEMVQRPPSGVSGAFWPRRRGFTAPPGTQPPLFGMPTLRACDGPRPRGQTIAAHNGSSVGPERQHAQIGAAIPPHHTAGTGCETAAPAAAAAHEHPRLNNGPVAAAAAAETLAASASPHYAPPAPQLHSSFSPPVSPHPRTICDRVRALMHWTRNTRPGAPQQQQHRHARSGPSLTMASVLCTASKPPPAAATGFAAASPGDGPRVVAPRKPGSVAVAGHKPRVLPRSPLANSVVFALDADHPATIGPAVPVDSSDEEGRVCVVCARFKNAEWTVQCDAAHPLCFGCVQQHVNLLLSTTPACTVVCPAGPCRAGISSKHLHACLPPHRLQQLLANRRRRDRPQGILRRSLSLCTRWRSIDSAGRSGSSNTNNSSDDGFDVPTPAPAMAPHAVLTAAQLTDAAQRRLTSSMPVLPPAAPAAAPASDPLRSELTRVEPGSLDSLVVAVSVAADSTCTLSPESVGSRLRRVPKARDNLAPRTWAVDGSSSNSSRFRVHELREPGPRSRSMHVPVSPAVSRSPPPPLPPPLPAAFRASATWITPSQRNSGYAEDLLLNATLFETIRSPLSDDDDDYGDHIGRRRRRSNSLAAYAYPGRAEPRVSDAPIADDDDDDGADAVGVYIPTWRKPHTARPRVQPLWTGDHEPQSAHLCEAAGLTFDLYETLHRRR